jgi:hypothetical protein
MNTRQTSKPVGIPGVGTQRHRNLSKQSQRQQKLFRFDDGIPPTRQAIYRDILQEGEKLVDDDLT